MLTNEILRLTKKIATKYNMDAAMFAAFISVESGGKGFDSGTGKILIQFEPAWMKRLAPYTPSGAWSVNKVDVQSKEWIAFNDAFLKNKEAAMKSTSIGLGQIMGFHYALLGYKTVGEMWDDAKKGLEQQIEQIAKFIKATPALYKAIIAKNFDGIASIYNGKGYKALAKKLGREPYDVSLEKEFKFYSKYPWQDLK